MATRHRTPLSFVLLCAAPPEAVATWLGLHLRSPPLPGRPAAVGESAASGRVRLTGMGPTRALRAAWKLAASLPDDLPVVVVGVGGALVNGFEAGDLVVASEIGTAQAGPNGELQVIDAPSVLDERSRVLAERLLEALSGRFPSTSFAPLLSAPRTVRGLEREVLARSGAVICDTESVWLSRLAERRPFAIVRSVVDTPERELVSMHTVMGGVRGLSRLASAAQVIAQVLGS
jgi:4-hydroxy-3-methylbut-2-en-1-yl diphosphate reductase